MAAICHTPIGGRTVRITRINMLGVPVTGACATATSTGWTSVNMSDDVDQPNDFEIRVGGAVTCLATRSRPLLNWVNTTIDFCLADPEVLNLLTGATLIADSAGDSAGFAADTDTYATASFALELWTGVAGTNACTTSGARYGYLLLPWLLGGVLGDITHERGTTSFQVAATTQVGNQWGSGPHDVVLSGAGTAVPLLAAIPSTRHRHWQITQVPPPTAVCGCQYLAA